MASIPSMEAGEFKELYEGGVQVCFMSYPLITLILYPYFVFYCHVLFTPTYTKDLLMLQYLANLEMAQVRIAEKLGEVRI